MSRGLRTAFVLLAGSFLAANAGCGQGDDSNDTDELQLTLPPPPVVVDPARSNAPPADQPQGQSPAPGSVWGAIGGLDQKGEPVVVPPPSGGPPIGTPGATDPTGPKPPAVSPAPWER